METLIFLGIVFFIIFFISYFSSDNITSREKERAAKSVLPKIEKLKVYSMINSNLAKEDSKYLIENTEYKPLEIPETITDGIRDWYKCPKCGESPFFPRKIKNTYIYCPNCGRSLYEPIYNEYRAYQKEYIIKLLKNIYIE